MPNRSVEMKKSAGELDRVGLELYRILAAMVAGLLQLKENIENSRNFINSEKTWKTQGTVFCQDLGKAHRVFYGAMVEFSNS